MTATDDDAQPTYKAMDMLTGEHTPTLKGRPPFWRPKAPTVMGEVRLPTWDWERPRFDDRPPVPDDELVSLDINAAFLSACSSGVFAHGALEHTGDASLLRPGLYLIDAHPWQEAEIVSPLGMQPLDDDRIWVAHPTALLLDKLSRDGFWPGLQIHDAWTSATSCRLRKWTDAVKQDRADVIRARAQTTPGSAARIEVDARYKAVKDGYSIAVQLMKGPAKGAKAKSEVRRPDWYATVHAQHAASMWRKAWSTVLAGHGPVAMGSVDELTYTADDLRELQFRAEPVLKIDPMGITLGTLSVKEPEDDQA